MNPQGNNNQQPQGNQAAPAGAWNAGIQINNAPPPLVLPAAQPVQLSWREECREEGWAAGDENLQSYLQQQSLVTDDGILNWALIDAMTNRPRAPEGLRMALITMAFLIIRRSFTLNELRRLRRLVGDLTQQYFDDRAHLLRSRAEGLRGAPLTQLQNDFDDLRDRLARLEAELQALQAEATNHQAEMQQAQRHLVNMFRGYVRFGPLLDINQYTGYGNVMVLTIPWPYDEAELRGEHLVVRYPATSMVFMMCLIGMPLMLIHPVNQNTPERPDQWGQTATFSAMNCAMVLLFAHLIDRLFGRRQ